MRKTTESKGKRNKVAIRGKNLALEEQGESLEIRYYPRRISLICKMVECTKFVLNHPQVLIFSSLLASGGQCLQDH